jgi:hypothetical protein
MGKDDAPGFIQASEKRGRDHRGKEELGAEVNQVVPDGELCNH